MTLAQVHRPGEVLQTDGTWMNTLGITLQGEAFPHLSIHCVLPYSNWEWGRVAQLESLLAIRLGLQSTLACLAYVPTIHQTDNMTAAMHHLGREAHDPPPVERAYNPEYLDLLPEVRTLMLNGWILRTIAGMIGDAHPSRFPVRRPFSRIYSGALP